MSKIETEFSGTAGEHTGGLPERVRSVVDDENRLRVFQAVSESDRLAHAKLDAVARLAADLMDCPMAFVSLIGKDSLWFAGRAGVSPRQVTIDQAIGAYVIAAPDDEVFVIEDARADPRFASNLQVTGEPFIRFYAALRLIADGEPVGVLCVAAHSPKPQPSQSQLQRFKDLAVIAGSTLQLMATERAKAKLDVAMRLETARHAFALRVAGIASWVWHFDTDVVECSSKLRELFGFPGLGTITVDQLFEAIHPEDRQRVVSELRRSREDNTGFTSEFRTGANDTWLFGHGQVLEHATDGKAKTFAGVFIDVTLRKLAEERQEEDRRKQALLLRELIHRVKNTLAVVQSITRQTLRSTPDPAAFARVFQARIASLAASHTLLAEHEWGRTELRQIIDAQVSPLIPGDKNRLTVSGPSVGLAAETATQIGLVFHELATNAVKHGSLSVNTGRVDIVWERQERQVRVRWTESGGPPLHAASKAASPGFGSTLIEMSVNNYRADYAPEGLSISFSIDMRSADDK